jgi:hypothetical protein
MKKPDRGFEAKGEIPANPAALAREIWKVTAGGSHFYLALF